MFWVNAILLWLHLGALALGGVATFGLPVIGARMGAAEPAGKAALGGVIVSFTKLANIALGTLIVTGLIMAWLRFGQAKMPVSAWFWVKMLAVVVLLGVIHMGRANARRAMGGDATAASRIPAYGKAGMASFLAVVACAVLAFH